MTSIGSRTLSAQSDVLDFLHRVCKGTGVWLKVGGVGSRIVPFKDGDPPVGMQRGQDIDPLELDVTLGNFATAKQFLERVMNGVLSPFNVSVADLLADGARDRMVLACGGAVARDYITLTEGAIDEAIERLNRQGNTTDQTVVRVRAEDVHNAVRRRIADKETESISKDADQAAATAINSRWRDVCEFAKSRNDSAFVLVEVSRLESEEWGSQILQLENLRLLHRVAEVVPKTEAWRGRRTVVYMIDLGQLANQRVTTEIVPFWTGQGELDRLRRAQWVYDPDWRTQPIPAGADDGDVAPTATAADASQQAFDLALFRRRARRRS